MPTVYRESGFRFSFYMNEGAEPPHIHVSKGDGQCKWWLDPLELDWSRGFKPKDLKQIATIVSQTRDFLLQQWNLIHGENN